MVVWSMYEYVKSDTLSSLKARVADSNPVSQYYQCKVIAIMHIVLFTSHILVCCQLS